LKYLQKIGLIDDSDEKMLRAKVDEISSEEYGRVSDMTEQKSIPLIFCIADFLKDLKTDESYDISQRLYMNFLDG